MSCEPDGCANVRVDLKREGREENTGQRAFWGICLDCCEERWWLEWRPQEDSELCRLTKIGNDPAYFPPEEKPNGQQ